MSMMIKGAEVPFQHLLNVSDVHAVATLLLLSLLVSLTSGAECGIFRAVYIHGFPRNFAAFWLWSLSMDKWTIKTPIPTCRLSFKIDLLTDIAALCLTDFIDWRYIYSLFVFSTQLVNCCPHGRRNYTCVLLSLYLLSDLPMANSKQYSPPITLQVTAPSPISSS